MSHLLKSIILVCTTTLLLSGCGDLSDKKIKKKDPSSQFAICKLDTAALTQIMTKSIEADINCLENNLKIFVDVVVSDRPGYLSLKELKNYIKKNRPKITADTVKLLSAVFELNSLFLGDDTNYIARNNIEKLSKLLVKFNKIVVDGNIYNYFTTTDSVSFYEHNRRKSIIYTAFIDIGKLLTENVVENLNKVSLKSFLKKVENQSNKEAIKTGNALIFLKKMFLGGDEKTLTAKELKHFTGMLGDFGKIAYDFIKLPKTTPGIDQDEKIINILKEDTRTILDNYFRDGSPDEILISFAQVKEIVNYFFPEYSYYLQYEKSIIKAKEVLVGSGEMDFTTSEIYFLLDDILFKNLVKGVFVYRSYYNHESLLGSIYSILHKISDLLTFSDEKTLPTEFNRVVNDYRFFQGKEISPLFDFNYSRDPRGLFEIFIYEDIVTRIFKFYGSSQKDVKGGYALTQKQLEVGMLDFSEIIEGENFILPGRAKNTAETINLMTSLFHIQSNGDGLIEIPEFTEFIITAFTSIGLANKIQPHMQEICSQDERGKIQADCYRENFLGFMKADIRNGKTLANYFPQLEKYLESLNEKGGYIEYLTATERFSRACNRFTDGTPVPMGYSDFVVSWGGLIAVENSMLRFDTDRSGILEPDEVEEAYIVYEQAIKGLIPYESLKKYSRKFFLYLVKYKKIPDIPKVNGWRSFWRAVRETGHFLQSLSRKPVSADRMTFAAVLRIIAENSPANLANPYPCDTLK